jgi:hypothetical protein
VGSTHNFRQNVTLFLKEAPNPADLDKVSWKEISLQERSLDYFLFNGILKKGEKFIQYKLKLDTGGTGTGPVVKTIEMSEN